MEELMRHTFSRRSFLTMTSMAVPVAHLSGFEQGQGEGASAAVADTFPQNAPAMVREAVIASHGNVKRIKELVDAHPALARAAYDWGFGDWEDCLGAASHIGNREIAEYLISKGARPSIFSAVMLGQLDTVKAFVAAQPGVQRIPGPHSIPLLAHARAGGPGAAAVLSYLEGLGDAGSPKLEPITDDEKAALAGTYLFGRGAADRIDITVDKGNLQIQRAGMPFARGLLHLGDKTFHPAGAAAVRVTFAGAGGASTLTITDGEIVVTATRRS
jgi:hypothetical protein